MTDTLQRITTEYIEAEDRIRLAGEAGEKTMVLWLTQRFLNRLIPHLCQWLDQRVGATPLTEVKQEFAQQKARAELEAQPPVRARPDMQGVLIHSVDLKPSRTGLGLHFKDVGGDVSKCPKRHFMRQMTQNLTKSGAEVALDTAGQ